MDDIFASEAGAVTVDWVVLTAALVGLGLAAMSVVSGGVEDLSTDVSNELQTDIISTSFGVDFRTMYIQSLVAAGLGYTEETAANLVDANMGQWAGYNPTQLQAEIDNTVANIAYYDSIQPALATWEANGGDDWGYLYNNTVQYQFSDETTWTNQKISQFGTQQAYVEFLHQDGALLDAKLEHLNTL